MGEGQASGPGLTLRRRVWSSRMAACSHGVEVEVLAILTPTEREGRVPECN